MYMYIFNDIPPHEPRLHASSSPTVRIHVHVVYCNGPIDMGLTKLSEYFFINLSGKVADLVRFLTRDPSFMSPF